MENNKRLISSSLKDRLVECKLASHEMATLTTDQKNLALDIWADLLQSRKDFLLEANLKDLAEQKDKLGISLFQRLKLDSGKVEHLIQGTRDLKRLPDPVGRTTLRSELQNGLVLERRTVPLGVLAIIFESRPDVVPQVVSLLLKSGNVGVLKGGSEARHSIAAFSEILARFHKLVCTQGIPLPAAWIHFVNSRAEVQEVLRYSECIDLVIPRGSNELVRSVMASTQIPVLGHADGICHIYVDSSVDLEISMEVIWESKMQYPAVCNALETLLLHKSVAASVLSRLVPRAKAFGLELRGCEKTQVLHPSVIPATEQDWRTEYGEPILSIRVVDSVEDAINHINVYGSHHTDAILSNVERSQSLFLQKVDSANVFVNASTRFADGYRYGFGAEIGISTSKTHARGPVGLEGLVSYKYELRGRGHRILGDTF